MARRRTCDLARCVNCLVGMVREFFVFLFAKWHIEFFPFSCSVLLKKISGSTWYLGDIFIATYINFLLLLWTVEKDIWFNMASWWQPQWHLTLGTVSVQSHIISSYSPPKLWWKWWYCNVKYNHTELASFVKVILQSEYLSDREHFYVKVIIFNIGKNESTMMVKAPQRSNE